MTEIYNKGCCARCQIPPPKPAFIGLEESLRRQAAYEQRRRITAYANGYSIEKKPLRGGGD